MFRNRADYVLLVLFTLVNIALYILSYEGASFLEGADASQYFYPALSFVEQGQFISGDGTPLTFGPPLYSILLAVPIYFFGLEDSAAFIVLIQCIMLYLTGFLCRQILFQFSSKYAFLLHAIVIFNPNSLITAHLIQSETLFTLFFVCSVIFAFKALTDFSFKNLILIGLFTGLATLVRPVALYLLLVWPLFIFIALIIKSRLDFGNLNIFNTKRSWAKLLIIVIVGGLVISPWYVRNYIKFGELFFSSNSGNYLELQYIRLKNKGAGWSIADVNHEHDRIFNDYLEKEGESNFCFINRNHWSCNSVHSRASLTAMKLEPIEVHFKALIHSWGTLFFSGGASNIRNYLGFEGKSLIVNFQNSSFSGLDSIVRLVKDMNFAYLFIFVLTFTFSVVTRFIGLFGVFYLFRKKEWLPYSFLLIEVLSIFVAAYLYLGQSRFRVPLEPILMLFTIIGIIYVSKKLKKVK